MWHQKFSKSLRDMGFRPCLADSDLWMRDASDYYEYVAIIVDDLLVISKQPELIIEPLKVVHRCELKGVGVP